MSGEMWFLGAQVPAHVAQRLLTELGEGVPVEEQAKALDRLAELYSRARRPANQRDEFTRANLQLWWDEMLSVRWVAGRGIDGGADLVWTITAAGIAAARDEGR